MFPFLGNTLLALLLKHRYGTLVSLLESCGYWEIVIKMQ